MKVRVLSVKGSGCLIEWYDAKGVPHRSIVPENEVQRTVHFNDRGKSEEIAFCTNPEWGIPYGENWENIIEARVPKEEIAGYLHKNGIWTLEDFFANPQIISDVFRLVGLKEAEALREAVREGISGG